MTCVLAGLSGAASRSGRPLPASPLALRVGGEEALRDGYRVAGGGEGQEGEHVGA